MNNNEKIKFIAQGLGFEILPTIPNRDGVPCRIENRSELFNPYLEREHAFMVLEALNKMTKNNLKVIHIGMIGTDSCVYINGAQSPKECNSLKEAICEAYLELIRE